MKKIFILLFGILLLNISINAQNIFTVTKTTDPDPFTYSYNYIDSLCDTTMYGTLQWAIRKANEIVGQCEIQFNISGVGQQTIYLEGFIPGINNKTFINGTTQAGYQAGNPQIILDGQNIVFQGLFFAHANGSKVEGIYIKNCTTQGIAISSSDSVTIQDCIINQISNGTNNSEYTIGIAIANSSYCIIKGNKIGTDILNAVLPVEDDGIMLWINSNNNIIGGILSGESNIIKHCGNRGVDIGALSLYNRISGNIITNCPIAIFLGIGSNNEKLAPVITLATNNTISGTSEPNDIIEIFGSTGNGNTNEYLGTTQADLIGNWSTILNTSFDYIVATATDLNNNTSVLSSAFQKLILPGTSCETAIELTTGITYLSVNSTSSNWYHFIPDTNSYYFIIPRDSSCITNISLYEGICGQNNLLISSDSLAILKETFIAGNDYYIQIIGNDLCSTYLKVDTFFFKYIDQNCPPIECCGKLSNEGFDIVAPLTSGTPQWISPYFWNLVCAWQCGWGTPQALGITDKYAYLWSYTQPSFAGTFNLVGEGIRQPIDLQPNRIYQMDIRYRTSNNNNNNISGLVNAFVSNVNYNVCLNGNTGSGTLYGTEIADIHDHGFGLSFPSSLTIQSTTVNFPTPNTVLPNSFLYVWPTSTHLNSAGDTVLTLFLELYDIKIHYPAPQFSYTSNCNHTVTLNNTTPHSNENIHNIHWNIYDMTGGLIDQANNIESYTHTFSSSYNQIQVVIVYDYIMDNGSIECTCDTTMNIVFPQLNVNITGHQNNICSNDNHSYVTANASNGTAPYSYLWNTTATTATIINLPSGTYSVTVTDATGCTGTDNFIITGAPNPVISLISPQTPCFQQCNGTIVSTVTNGTPSYTYNWSNGSHTANLIQLCSDSYTVTVIDGVGCTSTNTISLSTNPQINITTSSFQNECSGQSNGSIYVAVTGGTPNYIYNWSNGQNTNSIINLVAGNYTVTVTDANGCTAYTTFIVNSLSVPIITPTVTPSDPCVSLCNGSIILNVTPLDSYSYLWYYNGNIDATTQNIPTACLGGYTVVVTSNATGCSVTQPIAVNSLSICHAGTDTYISSDLLIPGNSGIIYVPGNIFITNNATLTISGPNTELRFMSNKRIELDKGCSLKLFRHSKLSSCCNMWDGVKAINNAAAYPNTVFISQSTIENAVIGINAYDYSKVLSYRSYFINNYVDFYLNKTKISHVIDSCTFETNIPQLPYVFYPSYVQNPYAHIYTIKNANKLNIKRSYFRNTTPFLTTDIAWKKGMGIYSDLTQVNVSHSEFTKLWYGVKSNYITKVDTNIFNGNNRGVLIEGLNSATRIIFNQFTITNNGNQYTSATYPWGAGVSNSIGYEIENNEFKNGFIGLAMIGNAATGRKVYKNSFDSLEHAFVANGTNSVKLTCNDFGLTVPNITSNILLWYGSINPKQDHAPYWDAYGISINSHNRFSTSKDLLPDSRKFNRYGSTQTYDYYWGVYPTPYNDLTRISPPSWTPVTYVTLHPALNPSEYYNSLNCLTEINGNKSVGKELTKVDLLKDALTYRNNYYNALVDNGNTDYLLSLIQNMKPNNFNFAYNQLMNASPYLSDAVLIQFMINPINKPPFKKDVVLANSPLPLNVRPYINQMNVNQNFKNQMWAAQVGTSPRVAIEMELENRDFGINGIFGDLVQSVLMDTIPQKTDSLLSYVLQKGSLNERLITDPVFIEKERYVDAQTNLTEISYLNQTGNQQIVDFIQLQQLQILLNQTPDSLQKNVILQNEDWINSIANDSTHFCMADALNLLEKANDTLYPRNVYIGTGAQLKVTEFLNNGVSENDEKEECSLTVTPNPAKSTVSFIVNPDEITENMRISIYDVQGRYIQEVEIKTSKEIYLMDINNYKKGIYYASLRINDNILCVRKLIVE
jgi:hypothetical protein